MGFGEGIEIIIVDIDEHDIGSARPAIAVETCRALAEIGLFVDDFELQI